jgi:hypothetical protein
MGKFIPIYTIEVDNIPQEMSICAIGLVAKF